MVLHRCEDGHEEFAPFAMAVRDADYKNTLFENFHTSLYCHCGKVLHPVTDIGSQALWGNLIYMDEKKIDRKFWDKQVLDLFKRSSHPMALLDRIEQLEKKFAKLENKHDQGRH
jgi:hypothetical protein